MPAGKITFASGHYLGGHPDQSRSKSGNLYFTDSEIGVGLIGPKHGTVAWSDAASIEITSEQVAKSRAGAALMFGVGALAAKSSSNKATIIVRTKDGHQIYFQLDNKDAAHVRAKVSALLTSAGVPFYAEVPIAATPAAGPDTIAQLAQLAQLREAGHLSDEEFQAQKARVLGG